MSIQEDIAFMDRAFQLALKGTGNVSPNPIVGCVIVHDGKVIGEGWHKKYGEPHAEVNAVNSVEDKSLLSNSTAYVTLEPCAHFGKTPPCADLLVSHRLKKVVIANRDPFELVDGTGIYKLEKGGVEVVVGVGQEKGLEINKRFFTYHQKKRPYIILKWAQTADGFIARENYDSKWISNEYSRKLAHKWRAEEDSILVGTNTALYDNPSLSVRDWRGNHPIRLVIDKSLKLDKSLNLFDRSIPTLIYNLSKDDKGQNLEYKKLDNNKFLESIMGDLYERKIGSVFVEGGAGVLNSFIEAGLWDEARVFKSSNEFQKGILAPRVEGRLENSFDSKGDIVDIIKNVQY
ncbi:bifunctional diaminohydroxyphosphoribosylaminopyrimidine deaminase/5-amino-6-(5-phosphoribosylamino)uracil reductase RibD [Reichenbachiella versicolor]|uniref:bifunctional diaminohydroxyphosphoribosylaminopyrimidine deaminase/5-amino-6-(5-phosphoribosylamino)uracil reductase RibD n=1 Tax=Reichenbachiella versicolor TaxID=1821036 RepID=UPI000D6DDF5C|nr:bifunctional diaminohydroxyphosphoribosylaminopyrimidine deaminase/5-amino-6-(5-phosphoribosylamino)uracil reductase RibD [Reichenbachiella versicolor]